MNLPLLECPGVPSSPHPGSFGHKRSFYYHPGVDLYSSDQALVFPTEHGIVVGKGIFTGPLVGTPFWETTYYLMVQSKNHVINYGEIDDSDYEIGDTVDLNKPLGKVKRVLPLEKFRPDVHGHSCSMLHFETYILGTTSPIDWRHGEDKPECLIDPTQYLLSLYKKTLNA